MAHDLQLSLASSRVGTCRPSIRLNRTTYSSSAAARCWRRSTSRPRRSMTLWCGGSWCPAGWGTRRRTSRGPSATTRSFATSTRRIEARLGPGRDPAAPPRRPAAALTIEEESTNCGENAEFSLRLLARWSDVRTAVVVQDPTMQRRTHASFDHHLRAGPRWRSSASRRSCRAWVRTGCVRRRGRSTGSPPWPSARSDASTTTSRLRTAWRRVHRPRRDPGGRAGGVPPTRVCG